MRRTLAKLAPVLHLTRVTTAFAAIANVWFVILWTDASGPEVGTPALSDHPMWMLLLGGAANALGLFAFAASLNDVLDLRRDRTLNPERPLASGRITLDAAVSLVVGTLMVAVLGASVLGVPAVLLTLLVAAAILFFNAAGKFVPAVGLVALGLIYAGQMVVPNLELVFVWPVWLVMTHSLVVAAVVHMLKRKVPTLSRRAMGLALAGWVFWSVVILVSGWARSSGNGGLWPDWVSPRAAVGPAALAVVFALMSYRKVRLYGPGPRAANKIARYGALWLALYACAWLFGQSIWGEEAAYARAAWILTALSAAGFVGMTVLREAYALLEHPLGYRR